MANKTTKKDDNKGLVSIRLFKDGKNYKDDVFVGINGKRYKIKRGVETKVPKEIAIILQRSRDADIQTSNLIESLNSDFEGKKGEFI